MMTVFWKLDVLVAVVGKWQYKHIVPGMQESLGGGKATEPHKRRLRSPNLRVVGAYS